MYNDDYMRQMSANIEKFNENLAEAADEREQKEQERVEREKESVAAAKTQADYAERSYPFVVYTAIIATIALILAGIQFFLWLSGLFSSCPTVP